MGKFSLRDVAGEVATRVDDVEGIPKLKKSGMYELLQAAFDVIGQAVAAGEEIAIPQFGKFFSTERSARKGRNPKTGEAIKIAAKTVPKFRASSGLRLKVAEANAPKEKVKKKSKKKKK